MTGGIPPPACHVRAGRAAAVGIPFVHAQYRMASGCDSLSRQVARR